MTAITAPRYCAGADDPEDRCPKHPNECRCWRFNARDRRMIAAGYGDRVNAADGERCQLCGDFVSDPEAAVCARCWCEETPPRAKKPTRWRRVRRWLGL